MLYIAEVKKQTKTFLGGFRTVFHLLACQQKDNVWSAIPGEETISTEDVTQVFAEGALVTVNLGANRQIQGKTELAGMKVANLLQSLSRQVDKAKEQEQEIEEWKNSLTLQLKEIQNRQENLKDAEQELQDREQNLSDLEQERQEIQQLREQWESDRAEIEGAWEQLRGERQRLEQLKGELDAQQRLSPERAEALRELVEKMEDAVSTAQVTLDPIKAAQHLVNEQAEIVSEQRETLTQDRQVAEQKKATAEQSKQQLLQLRQQLQQKEPSFLENQQRLGILQSQLEAKQQIVTYLGAQLQKQSEARDILSRIVINSPQLKIKQEVDTQALEEMPIEELQEQFESMQKSFEEAVSFVKDQEEELDYQLQSVRDLEAQLEEAASEEQENIKNELAEEQDRYRFLEKTLVGQRRNLMAREDILEQHKTILENRQGNRDGEEETSKVDLSPIFNKVDSQRDYSEDEFHQVNNEIETLKSQLEALQGTVKQQEQECKTTRAEIEKLELLWQEQEKEANELITRVEINEEFVEQRETQLKMLGENLEAAAEQAQQMTSEEQQEQLSQMKELLKNIA